MCIFINLYIEYLLIVSFRYFNLVIIFITIVAVIIIIIINFTSMCELLFTVYINQHKYIIL